LSKKIYEKLLTIQTAVNELKKDKKTDDYSYVSSELVLDTIRPMLNNLHLLLLPTVTSRGVHTDTTKSGTARYLTEVDITWTWVDVDSGETLAQPFYAQGVDLAGEKGVGKAITYGEKYYLLKVFHIATPKDDPDGDATTKSGEKKQKGTQAAKETADLQRKSIQQIAATFASGGKATAEEVITHYTKNDAANYPGVKTVDEISATALPVVYANMKTAFKKRTGNEFEYKPEDEQ
jgi:hypothetical protein